MPTAVISLAVVKAKVVLWGAVSSGTIQCVCLSASPVGATLVPSLMLAFSVCCDTLMEIRVVNCTVRDRRRKVPAAGAPLRCKESASAGRGRGWVKSVLQREVRRSRRSSVWPILFYGFSPTSLSGTAADPREESSPRGTGAICLCSGPAGRNHTGGGEKRDFSLKYTNSEAEVAIRWLCADRVNFQSKQNPKSTSACSQHQ